MWDRIPIERSSYQAMLRRLLYPILNQSFALASIQRLLSWLRRLASDTRRRGGYVASGHETILDE